jgi:SAM-dependent methyltransferase
MPEQIYHSIVRHYEECFRKYGDTPGGLDWPNLPDLLKRYKVMLDVIRSGEEEVSLLDFGCGTAMLKTYIDQSEKHRSIKYAGLDLGESFVAHCQRKFPGTDFYRLDILQEAQDLPQFDYIVMNGVFTEKRGLSFDEMFAYLVCMLKAVFVKAERGIVFNVMSKAVH